MTRTLPYAARWRCSMDMQAFAEKLEMIHTSNPPIDGVTLVLRCHYEDGQYDNEIETALRQWLTMRERQL